MSDFFSVNFFFLMWKFWSLHGTTLNIYLAFGLSDRLNKNLKFVSFNLGNFYYFLTEVFKKESQTSLVGLQCQFFLLPLAEVEKMLH